MVNFAARHGLDEEHCLLGTGIEPEQFHDEEQLISREQELRLVENLVLALPDTCSAGFELGLLYNIATFGPWGFALRTSRDLRSAVTLALRYLPLSTAYCHIRLQDNGSTLGLFFDGRDIPAVARDFLVMRDIGTAMTLLKELTLLGGSLLSVELAIPQADSCGRIAEVCGVKPQFRSKHNALFLRREDVDRPLPTFDANLVRMLEDQCRTQLERRQTIGTRGQVRALILGPLGLVATLEEVAKKLHCSPRSLRRKLDSEGASFRQILDTERRQLAEQLLRSSDMTLDEMAIHLGYSDTASFTRAFRRWHDISPGQFRRSAANA